MTSELAQREKKLKGILLEMKTGDKDTALIQLIDFMEPRLYSEALKFLRDTHEASAAVNYVWAKLWNKAHQFNDSRPAMPYVISVLRNLCRDIIRKKQNSIKTVDIDARPKLPRNSYLEHTSDFYIDELPWTIQRDIEDYMNGDYTGSATGLRKKITEEIM
jgi:RNA polymerase sigma factor (sigma-70 family)